ncbi:Trp biosynthesis-associated membrane protein [Actinoplanes sp. NPDC051861]|uniref:Trp biosynthesis-associated membrane protein n=1 Tax=Actinoplanes sp. NPDC051861 TaxID=3155170 RepID=UPI003438091D
MRRSQLSAVLACLFGAGITLFALFRVWSVRVEERPGLPDLRTSQTGADVQPWLIGVAVVALAGTGALLATRGVVRRGLGVVLVVAGVGVVVGAVVARVGLDVGDAGVGGSVWPIVVVLGGAGVVVGGVLAARYGHLWAAMSSRYERSVDSSASGAPPSPAPGRGAASGGREPGVDSRAFWEALDRGEDPTAR